MDVSMTNELVGTGFAFFKGQLGRCKATTPSSNNQQINLLQNKFVYNWFKICFTSSIYKFIERSTPVCSTSNIKMITNTLVHKHWYPKQENKIILKA